MFLGNYLIDVVCKSVKIRIPDMIPSRSECRRLVVESKRCGDTIPRCGRFARCRRCGSWLQETRGSSRGKECTAVLELEGWTKRRFRAVWEWVAIPPHPISRASFCRYTPLLLLLLLDLYYKFTSYYCVVGDVLQFTRCCACS